MPRRHGRKRYFLVIGPEIFGSPRLDYIISSGSDNVIGRRLEVQLSRLTGNPVDTYIKCRLRVVGVDGGEAFTVYDGHEYFREFIRSLFIKRTSHVEIYRDVYTDRRGYRLYVGVFTKYRVTNSRKKAIRRRVFNILDKWSGRDDDEFLRRMIYKVIDTEIFSVAKKVAPVRWCGILKVKTIQA